MSHSDILVIGDGPAGCAAAMVAANAGCEVVMLGGGFSHAAPECVSARALKFLGLLAPGLSAQSDTWLDVESDHIQGRVVVRHQLDDALRFAASACGVAYLRQPLRPLLPCVENGRVVGVMRGMCGHKASIVIDATGINGCLRRGLSLEESIDSSPVWLRRGFARGRGSQNDTDWQIAQEGWLWIRSASTQWIWTSLSTRKDTDIASRAGLAVTGMVWRQCRRWRHLRQAAGAGYFICGDAAGYLDPASGDGLRFAIAGAQFGIG
jgi:flavin-dependent dehydrogenase